MRLAIMTIWMCFVATITFAQDSYLVQPGDRLQIEVLEDTSLNRTVIVLPDGRFSFPFAGTVRAGGRSLGQVERTLTDAIASNFTLEPNVFISVANLRSAAPNAAPQIGVPQGISVYFVGEVASPGQKIIPPGTTFLQALASSGGFTNFAADKRIQVRRGQQVFNINYDALERGSTTVQDLTLINGDVILVPERRLFE